MRQLDEGVPPARLADRADVSVPVLKKHYDNRKDERKRKARLNTLEEHLPEFGSDSDPEDRFGGSLSITGPTALAAVGTVKAINRTAERLHRELAAMSPCEGLVRPTSTKVAKGVAAYMLFVALLAVNFALLGVTSYIPV